MHKVYGHLLKLQSLDLQSFQNVWENDTEILHFSFLLIPSFSSITIYWKVQNVKEGRNGRLAAFFEGNIIFFIVGLNLFSVRNPFDMLKFIANHDLWCAGNIVNIYLISEHTSTLLCELTAYIPILYSIYSGVFSLYTPSFLSCSVKGAYRDAVDIHSRSCFIAIYGK